MKNYYKILASVVLLSLLLSLILLHVWTAEYADQSVSTRVQSVELEEVSTQNSNWNRLAAVPEHKEYPSETWQDTVHSYWETHGTRDQFIIVEVAMDLGLGNRIPNILTGIMLGLLLNRTVLIYGWQLDAWSEIFDTYRPVNCFHSAQLEDICQQGLSFGKRLNWIDTNDARKHQTANWERTILRSGDMALFYRDYSHLVLRSADYLAPLFMENPRHQWLFDQLGFRNPSGIVYRSFLFPSQKMLFHLNASSHSHYPTIGLHLRLQKRIAAARMPVNIDLFFSLAKMIAANSPSNSQFGIYLASDTPALVVPHANGFISSNPTFHLLNSTTLQRSQTPLVSPDQSDFEDMAELLLLSRSNFLVLTEGSSFGWTASLIGNISPCFIQAKSTFWCSPIADACFFSFRHPIVSNSHPSLLKSLPSYLFHFQCHPYQK